MFPQTLQRAQRPAETLAVQRTDAVGNFGIAESLALVFDSIAGATDSPRQIHVFGHRVGAVAAGLHHGFAPPSAHGARNDSDGVHHRVRAAIEVLARDVFD